MQKRIVQMFIEVADKHIILADRQSEPDIESVINDLRRAHSSRIKEKDQIRIERLKKFKEG